MTNIIVLCTANVCRSVIARELLNRRLADRRVRARVRSAGMLDSGEPAAPEVVRALGAVGIDVSAHRSRRMTDADLHSADLVLAMAREHLRYAVVLTPPVWPRTFTIREFVRRAASAGPRRPDQPLPDWLDRVHHGRDRLDLLGERAADDIADPIGGPPEGYDATVAQLDDLTQRLIRLAWGPEAPQ
ncbi:MAG: arsenate reductase/protein-tyrosine-phosphatase family protein [Streptosporangiaceae bacterium]